MKRMLVPFMLIIVFFSNTVYGQSIDDKKSFIGVFLSQNLNFHSYTSEGCCGFTPAKIVDDNNSLQFGVLFGIKLSSYTFLKINAGLENLQTTWKFNSLNPVQVNSGNDSAFIESALDYKMNYFNIDFLYGYTPVNSLNLYAGIKGSYIYKNNFKQSSSIIDSSSVTFDNGQRTQILVDQKIKDLVNFELRLKAGISYEFRLRDFYDLYFVPEIYYSFLLNKILYNSDWKYNQIQLSLSLYYKL